VNIPGIKTVATSIMVAAISLIGAHPSHAERPESGRSQSQNQASPVAIAAGLTHAPPDVQVAQVEHDFTDWLHAWQMSVVDDYVHAVQMAAVTDYVNAVASAEASAAASRSVPRSSAPSGGTVSGGGSCYGGPIPDYIVTRESGGNPSAQNASGAWGCYQIMPEWWSGSCSGFDKYSVEGQKQCAALIWNGGAGSGNWALTR
jgi:hypothetical protein